MSNHRQNGQISWKVWTIIALVFVIGISSLVLTARQSRPSKPAPVPLIQPSTDDPVRAIVNGKAITEAELELAASQWSGGKTDSIELNQAQILERLVQQKLLVELGQDMGVENAIETRTRLQFTRDQILAEDGTKAFLAESVSENDIMTYYESERRVRSEQIQVRARQVVTPDEATAREIIRRLDKGEAFATLALAFSLDRASRESGGDLGFLNFDMLDPLLSEKIFAAADGDRIAPFETSQGWHVIEVISRRKAPIPSLEERRDAITALLKARKLETQLQKLRQKANIQIFQD